MNIRNHRELKTFAAGRLQNSPNLKKIIVIYAALVLGLSGLTTIVNYVLGQQMDNLSGLSNMGKRNLFSSIQSMLPMLLSLVTMCLELGLTASMLRVARGQYVSEQTLRLGFDRFWLILRCSILMGFRYAATLFLSIYAGIMIFMMLPISQPAMAILQPYLSEMSVLSGQIVLDDAAYIQFAQAVWPAYVICGILFAVAAVPLWYSYRMTSYIIIDKPGMSALMAMRESKQMMRKNRISLFRLDLSFWWYYLALFGAQVVSYGDEILPLLGIPLPGNLDVWYFLFMVLYLLLVFAIYFFLRGKMEVTYALAYDSLKPEENNDNSVVLGNIFQM